MMIFTAINKIPTPDELMKRLMAYAKIDFIKNPEDDDDFFGSHFLRTYHYDKDWINSGHFFKIDDSGGDHYHILFSAEGCMIKGFDHECEVSPYNYDESFPIPNCISEHDFYKGAPDELITLINDPALEKEIVTFCTWQSVDDNEWQFAPSTIPKNWCDGIDTFLYYSQNFEQYCEWFEECYETEPDINILRSIFEGNSITADMVAALNPDVSPTIVLDDLQKMFTM